MPIKTNTGGLKEFYYTKEDSERIERDDSEVLDFKVALRGHYQKVEEKRIVHTKVLKFSLFLGVILIILIIIWITK